MWPEKRKNITYKDIVEDPHVALKRQASAPPPSMRSMYAPRNAASASVPFHPEQRDDELAVMIQVRLKEAMEGLLPGILQSAMNNLMPQVTQMVQDEMQVFHERLDDLISALEEE